MTAIPVALLGSERGGRDPGTPLVLPAAEAAGDRDDVWVAELLERVGGERRPVPTGAEHHERLVLGAELRLGLGLEVPARDEHRAGDRSLVVLVLFADVEELRLAELGLGLLG